MLKAAQAYFQTQVNTTSQGQLLLMLYDGAIKFLRQAKDKMAERDYAQKGILISKAIDVISELDSSLNVQRGGDIAQNLHNLYFFCNTRLLQANMKMDQGLLDEVIKILGGLREAFAQAMNALPAEQQPRADVLPAQAQQPAPQQQAQDKPYLKLAQPPKPAPRENPQQPAQALQPEVAAPERPQSDNPPPNRATDTDKPVSPDKPGAKVMQSKLLAGSNIYRKMAASQE
jgi:flagellar secretion chaperone FliS